MYSPQSSVVSPWCDVVASRPRITTLSGVAAIQLYIASVSKGSLLTQSQTTEDFGPTPSTHKLRSLQDCMIQSKDESILHWSLVLCQTTVFISASSGEKVVEEC